MQQYIIRRVLWLFPVLFGVGTIIFVIMRIVPGDVALVIFGGESASITEEALAQVRQELGLDKPIYVQYLDWMGGIVRLDFGQSFWTKRPILTELGERFPLTAQIAVMAMAIALLIAIPVGILSAVRQNTWIDYALRVFAITGLAIPSFWMAILIILFLVLIFHWSPPLGYESPLKDPLYNLQVTIWPAIAVGYRQAAVATRMTRSCLLEVLREDYIRTAWAKGLRERAVILNHALKNAILPVITIVGINFAFLFGGLIVTETVFALPGMGRYVVDSIYRRDYPAIQAIVLVIAAIVVLSNLVVDLLYAWLDPRVRYR